MSNAVNTKFIESQNELLQQAAFKGEWSDWKPTMAAAIMMIGVTFIKSKNAPNTEANMRRFATSIANYASKLFEAAGGEVQYSTQPEILHQLEIAKTKLSEIYTIAECYQDPNLDKILAIIEREPASDLVKSREFWIMPDGHHYLTVHTTDPRKSKIAIHGEIIHVIEQKPL